MPKVAVSIVNSGQGRQAGELLETLLFEAFVNSGKYVAIERKDEYLKQLDKEFIKQRDGSVEESEIKRLGKQAGIDFMCVVKVIPGYGDFQLSAKMIDIETATVVGMGVTHSSLRSMDNMTKAANELVDKILGNNAPAGKFMSGVARASESGGSVSRQHTASPVTPQQTFFDEFDEFEEKELKELNQQQVTSPATPQPPTANTVKRLITTNPPYADIYIGGKFIGMSNTGEWIDVPVGTHTVKLVKGGNAVTTTMTFSPDSPDLVNHNNAVYTASSQSKPVMQETKSGGISEPTANRTGKKVAATADSMKLSLDVADPRYAGADIYINDKFVGIVGSNIDVPVGTHKVRFVKKGIEGTAIMTFYPHVPYQAKIITTYQNFTFWKRFQTTVSNPLSAGLGSLVLMNDGRGAGIVFGLMFSGAMMVNLVENEVIKGIGAITSVSGLTFSLVRPWTYNKPRPKYAADNANPYGDVKFAVLPDQNGDFKAVVAYELSF
jgi:hypothetical protein